MKYRNYILASLLVVLGGCETLGLLSKTTSSATGTQGNLHACIMEEAVDKVQDGTVFSAGVSATASTIANSCLKKLALQKAGLNTQATNDATNALQSLMDTAQSVGGLMQ